MHKTGSVRTGWYQSNVMQQTEYICHACKVLSFEYAVQIGSIEAWKWHQPVLSNRILPRFLPVVSPTQLMAPTNNAAKALGCARSRWNLSSLACSSAVLLLWAARVTTFFENGGAKPSSCLSILAAACKREIFSQHLDTLYPKATAKSDTLYPKATAKSDTLYPKATANSTVKLHQGMQVS